MERNDALTLVSGATSGIGSALVRRLAGTRRLLLHGRDETALRELRASLPDASAHDLGAGSGRSRGGRVRPEGCLRKRAGRFPRSCMSRACLRCGRREVSTWMPFGECLMSMFFPPSRSAGS